jgi:hypothetical protein
MDRRLQEGRIRADGAGLNRLHELSKRHRKTYETQYADVRNLHVAHNVLVDANARWAMFQKTRIRDFEKLIVFLNQPVRSLAAKKLKDLRDAPAHEHIVAETRMCMSLITRAAKALPKTSRRALRWG